MAVLTSLQNAEQWLKSAIQELQAATSTVQTVPAAASPQILPSKIAWGSKVSPEFKKRVLWIADQLGCDPSHLMACMAWESGRTFSAAIRNAAGSGAVGLIQFMPKVAKALGTSTAALAQMTPEDQLRFVYEYFKPKSGKLQNLGDIYMAILWPAGIGKPDSFVLFNRTATVIAYRENAGLDSNHDGLVTRGECLVKIKGMLNEGLLPQNLG